MTPVRVRVVAIDPPFEAEHGMVFGMQRGRSIHAPLPADRTAAFEFEIEVGPGRSGRLDFRGPFVHGRPGDRFLYLWWGPAGTEQGAPLARAKLKLGQVATDLLDRCRDDGSVLVAELMATDDRGRPASGTIREPGVRWSVAPDPTDER